MTRTEKEIENEIHQRDTIEYLCREVAEIKCKTTAMLEKNEKNIKWLIALTITVLICLFGATTTYLYTSSKKIALYEDLKTTKASTMSLNILANWMYEYDCNRQRAEQYKKTLDIQKEVNRGGDVKINLFDNKNTGGSCK